MPVRSRSCGSSAAIHARASCARIDQLVAAPRRTRHAACRLVPAAPSSTAASIIRPHFSRSRRRSLKHVPKPGQQYVLASARRKHRQAREQCRQRQQLSWRRRTMRDARNQALAVPNTSQDGIDPLAQPGVAQQCFDGVQPRLQLAAIAHAAASRYRRNARAPMLVRVQSSVPSSVRPWSGPAHFAPIRLRAGSTASNARQVRPSICTLPLVSYVRRNLIERSSAGFMRRR